jgi:hypothetical protein
MFDYRRVSQERVIGLSFVDILIQTVFVLLIALFVGYLDPSIRIELEEKSAYGQIGRDLCHKLNKDSAEACREYIEVKGVYVKEGGAAGYSDVGEEICKAFGAKSPEKCKSLSAREMARLRPCIKPANEYRVPPTMSVSVVSPSEIEFLGFSSEYILRLREKEDQVRLGKAMDKAKGQRFTPEEFASAFEFVREETCYHMIPHTRPGRYSDEDLKSALAALWRLREPRR